MNRVIAQVLDEPEANVVGILHSSFSISRKVRSDSSTHVLRYSERLRVGLLYNSICVDGIDTGTSHELHFVGFPCKEAPHLGEGRQLASAGYENSVGPLMCHSVNSAKTPIRIGLGGIVGCHDGSRRALRDGNLYISDRTQAFLGE